MHVYLARVFLATFFFCFPLWAAYGEETAYKNYYHKEYGYQFRYPATMKAEEPLKAVQSVFSDQNTRIEIYYDDFRNTIHNAASYSQYGNRFLENQAHHTLLYQRPGKVNGRDGFFTKWERKKLKHLAEDKNYYFSADIYKSEKEVYTIFIKSSLPIKNEEEILKNFYILPGDISYVSLPSKWIRNRNNDHLTPEAKRIWESLSKPQHGLIWGIFEPQAPGSMDSLEKIETAVSYKFPVLVRYQSMNRFIFPREEMENAWREERMVQLTLQTSYLSKADQAVLYDILDGKYDQEITAYAREAANFGHPFLFRLNNEMNGDWCYYSAYHHSKDTLIYQEVWKYLYGIFKKEGANNALWVWNPNHDSKPGFAWNHSLLYYPGDAYVDIVGLTAYNTGTYYSGEEWKNFFQLYRTLYDTYNFLSEKPLIITEFGSSSHGGDKSRWIQDMFDGIGLFPRISLAVWWSGTDWDQDGKAARIYRLDETQETLEAFSLGIKAYKEGGVTLLE